MWAMLKWWYGSGWLNEVHLQLERLSRVEEYFSFGTLARTMFQPFRQIDAGTRRGGLNVQFRAWLDKTVSRLVGAVARLFLLVVGSLWWVVSSLVSCLWLVVWLLLPFAPVLGYVLMSLKVGMP